MLDDFRGLARGGDGVPLPEALAEMRERVAAALDPASSSQGKEPHVKEKTLKQKYQANMDSLVATDTALKRQVHASAFKHFQCQRMAAPLKAWESRYLLPLEQLPIDVQTGSPGTRCHIPTSLYPNLVRRPTT